jgi:DNA repair photolyase
MHKKPEEWHNAARARGENVLGLFEKDCVRLAKERADDETRRVLFCFLSDPYQPLESELHLTRRGISVAARHGIKVDILTKGDGALIEQDLPLMLESQTHLGITLSFINDASRREWEPMASTVQSRLNILRKAHEMGIYTWVSMEPVIVPDEALEVIRQAHDYVDFWKVGKLNHNKEVECSIDWPKFRDNATALLDSLGSKYYIKEDLRKAI